MAQLIRCNPWPLIALVARSVRSQYVQSMDVVSRDRTAAFGHLSQGLGDVRAEGQQLFIHVQRREIVDRVGRFSQVNL